MLKVTDVVRTPPPSSDGEQTRRLNVQGGPIFLVTGGETNGEGIPASSHTFFQAKNSKCTTDVVPLIENGTIQVYTDVLQGASIVLEHRYFGKSCPYQYQDLSEKHLKHLTIQQAIDDLAYFAKNVELNLGAPGSSKSSSHPDNTPWVIVGNGYAGAHELRLQVDRLDEHGIFFRRTYELGNATVCSSSL